MKLLPTKTPSCGLILIKPTWFHFMSLLTYSASMERTVLRLNQHKIAFHVLGVFSILLFMQKVGATQFKVGGEMGWTVPSPSAVHYNQWAEKTRFRIGDSLCKLR